MSTRTFIFKLGGKKIWDNAKCLFSSWYFNTDNESIGYKDDELSLYKFEDGNYAIVSDRETVYLDEEQMKKIAEWGSK